LYYEASARAPVVFMATNVGRPVNWRQVNLVPIVRRLGRIKVRGGKVLSGSTAMRER
jgi:hypothetical protein